MKNRPTRYGSPDPEDNDDTPVAMPVGYCKPSPLEDLIASMIREAVQDERKEEFETEAEANDFEPEEEENLLDMSPYTLTDLEEETPVPRPDPNEAEAPQAPSEAPQEKIDEQADQTPPSSPTES